MVSARRSGILGRDPRRRHELFPIFTPRTHPVYRIAVFGTPSLRIDSELVRKSLASATNLHRLSLAAISHRINESSLVLPAATQFRISGGCNPIVNRCASSDSQSFQQRHSCDPNALCQYSRHVSSRFTPMRPARGRLHEPRSVSGPVEQQPTPCIRPPPVVLPVAPFSNPCVGRLRASTYAN